jgi:serine phosphatase RsbU (regulator of sigma subunit)
MITFKKHSRLGSPESADPRVRGDFAECFPLDTDRIAIVIGDVSGRSTAAAETAAALLKLARIAVTSRDALRRALARVDDVFTRTLVSDATPLASLFLAVADGKDNVMDCASAGHEAAMHFINQTRHERLEPTGPKLGLGGRVPGAFAQRRVHLGHHSVLAVLTGETAMVVGLGYLSDLDSALASVLEIC